jgi:GAF domain-containing protein
MSIYSGVVFFVSRSSKTINQQRAALARTAMNLQVANGELHEAQERVVVVSHDTETRAKKLQALAELSRGVTATLDPAHVFETIVRAGAALLEGTVATVWTLEGEALLLRASQGAHEALSLQRRLRLGEGLVGAVAQQKQPRLVLALPDTWQGEMAKDACAEGQLTAAGFPLLVEDRCLGVLMVARPVAQLFTLDDVALLSTLANQAAVAVDNALLYQELRRLPHPLQGRQGELRALEDETLLQFAPSHPLLQTLALHDEVGHQAQGNVMLLGLGR